MHDRQVIYLLAVAALCGTVMLPEMSRECAAVMCRWADSCARVVLGMSAMKEMDCILSCSLSLKVPASNKQVSDVSDGT